MGNASLIEFETETQKSLLGSHAGPLKNRHTVRGPLTITQAVITVIELTSFHVFGRAGRPKTVPCGPRDMASVALDATAGARVRLEAAVERRRTIAEELIVARAVGERPNRPGR